MLCINAKCSHYVKKKLEFIHNNYYNLKTKYYWQKAPRCRLNSIYTLWKRDLWSPRQMGRRERTQPSISYSLPVSFLMPAKIINRLCNTMYRAQEKCYYNRNSKSYWPHCINTQDLTTEAIKMEKKIKGNKEVIYEQHTFKSFSYLLFHYILQLFP